MTAKAFDKIAAGLQDAVAYSKGDATRGRVREMSPEKTDHEPVGAKPGVTQDGSAEPKE